jgi:polyhydroxyalkanoate synthesis regulator phasin
MRSAVPTLALCAAVLAIGTRSAAAQEYRHIERLANDLAKHADHLHDEADRHFKDRPLLHKHAREIEQEARHIARAADKKEPIPVLRRHLREIHENVDHLKRHTANLPNNQAGRHFREELDKVHVVIKHLQEHLK